SPRTTFDYAALLVDPALCTPLCGTAFLPATVVGTFTSTSIVVNYTLSGGSVNFIIVQKAYSTNETTAFAGILSGTSTMKVSGVGPFLLIGDAVPTEGAPNTIISAEFWGSTD